MRIATHRHTRIQSLIPLATRAYMRIATWTIGASIAAWWKNNSFTCLACEADAWRKCQEKDRKQDSEQKGS